ncbi:hypothetical protein Taro_056467 [Colocasia esculenta]|uniref:Uncharacterized protein n=1 Tax=Colocasia esculenta TaxID=4460 RepID=A0A843XW97_COLES|nr:hypothetical protein [Colocasia esculenta]
MGIPAVDWAAPVEQSRQQHNPTTDTSLTGERGPMAGGIVFPQLCSSSPTRLTVWCKSLLFHGNGYTVYDGSSGRVVFRVDNYAHDWREETVLMDCAGGVLLTIRRRRKRLGISERWMAYKGDGGDAAGFDGGKKQRPLFKAQKEPGLPCFKVFMASHSSGGAEPSVGYTYRMNWSRQEHWSRIYQLATASGALPVAEVRRKCGVKPEVWLGEDVLTLEVQPGMDPAIAMALMIITRNVK